ncbi:hypothetical protein MMC29_002940 [Sticta canariensis]|nr:hypothetical protein [Sticta canariensis]
MSSVVLKLGSLVIKTLSKPIARGIKAQAQEHERFRRICISFAQSIHRWDMRLRLGLLQDMKSIEKQAAREFAEAQAKKHKLDIPTVKTEAQTIADEAAAIRAKEKSPDKVKVPAILKPKIRPLSESKAIDSGATFVSEGFLFAVGISLILFENWRSRRKENTRREDVADRISELEESEKSGRRALVELEKEILRLRAKIGMEAQPGGRILPKDLWEPEENEDQMREVVPQGWFSWIRGQGKIRDFEATAAPETPAAATGPVSSGKASVMEIPSTQKPEKSPSAGSKSSSVHTSNKT